MKFKNIFSRFAHSTTNLIGRPGTFVLAVVVIAGWFLSGRYFHYSETWKVAIEMGLTTVTFLMVLLLQHSQNHDTRVIQMKLDELIHSHVRAKNDFIEIEKLSEAEVETIREERSAERQKASQQ